MICLFYFILCFSERNVIFIMLRYYAIILFVYLYFAQKNIFNKNVFLENNYICNKIIFFYIIGFLVSCNIFNEINIYYFQETIYPLFNIIFVYTSFFFSFFLFSFFVSYILYPNSHNDN